MEKSNSSNFRQNIYKNNRHYKNGEFKIMSNFKSSIIKLTIKDEWGYHKMSLNSLLKGSRPTIKSAMFPLNYLNNKLFESHFNFKYNNYCIIEYNGWNNVKVKTPFGIVITNVSNLYRGSELGIGCAENKSEFGLNYLNKIHNNRYEILPFIFKNSKQYLTAICSDHGKFKITYDQFKYRGCPKCGNEAREKHTKTDFIEKYYKKFLTSQYTYENFNYIDSHTKGYITCVKHGDFPQTPNNHYNGQGCPICANEFKVGSFKWWNNTKGKTGILYIIKCYNDTEEFLKIGITSQSVEKRYRKAKLMPYKYEILKEYEYTDKEIPFLLEKHLLQKFKNEKYNPEISFGGSKQECFKIPLEIIEDEIEKYLNKNSK